MERAVKYRVWCSMMNRYENIQGYASFDEDGTVNVHIQGILEQYTGAKDKNGKDVYEGDICRSDDVERPFVVEWNDDACAFLACIEAEKVPLSWFSDKNAECIIIGNIHKNPELLSDGN